MEETEGRRLFREAMERRAGGKETEGARFLREALARRGVVMEPRERPTEGTVNFRVRGGSDFRENLAGIVFATDSSIAETIRALVEGVAAEIAGEPGLLARGGATPAQREVVERVRLLREADDRRAILAPSRSRGEFVGLEMPVATRKRLDAVANTLNLSASETVRQLVGLVAYNSGVGPAGDEHTQATRRLSFAERAAAPRPRFTVEWLAGIIEARRAEQNRPPSWFQERKALAEQREREKAEREQREAEAKQQQHQRGLAQAQAERKLREQEIAGAKARYAALSREIAMREGAGESPLQLAGLRGQLAEVAEWLRTHAPRR